MLKPPPAVIIVVSTKAKHATDNLLINMGKQHNKAEHKTRRKAYVKRKKIALKAKLKKAAPKAKA